MPPADTSRSRIARVLLLLVISPTEAPTATAPDFATPLAFATWIPALAAARPTLPVALMAAPEKIDASAFWSRVVVATAASKANLPPLAPAVASASLSPCIVAET